MSIVVDRIEGSWAVLLVDGEAHAVPRDALAPEAREGDTLDPRTLAPRVDDTARSRTEVAALQARLRRRKGRPPGGFDL
jgi:hypothetical protein